MSYEEQLNKLIEEGEGIEKFAEDGMTGKFISCKEYAEWIGKTSRFLELYHPDSELTKRFFKES